MFIHIRAVHWGSPFCWLLCQSTGPNYRLLLLMSCYAKRQLSIEIAYVVGCIGLLSIETAHVVWRTGLLRTETAHVVGRTGLVTTETAHVVGRTGLLTTETAML
jgi:hypothetical protein